MNEKEVHWLAKALGAADERMPEYYRENPGLFYKTIRNLGNAWRAVRGQDAWSVQDRYYEEAIDTLYHTLTVWTTLADMGPTYGTRAREEWLHEQVFDRNAESILTGAVHTFTAKIQTLNWFLEGPEDLLPEYVDMLENADYDSWTRALGRWVEGYCVYDIGGLMEIGWKDKAGTVPGGIYCLDSMRVRTTTNYDYPFVYWEQDTGEQKNLRRNSVMQLVSMPNPSEDYRGLGLSPVSRALRLAKLLKALYEYEAERLANLPPEGVATVTGLTMPQVKAAIQLHKQAKESKEQYTYPGILWLVAQKMPFSGAQQPVEVKLTPFSTLPEYFDKKTTIELFVKTLAITFGVDVAEFWQIEHHGATKAGMTIQAQKAKGKGVGLVISQIERDLNRKFLPPEITQRFDVQDDEDDLLRAKVRSAKIENVRKMYYAKATTGMAEGAVTQEPLITREEARWMLARDGILPKEMMDNLGVRPLEPTAHFRIYSHAMKSYLPEPEIPTDYRGLERWVGILRNRLENELAQGR